MSWKDSLPSLWKSSTPPTPFCIWKSHIRLPRFFSHTIPGYLQVLSKSKRPILAPKGRHQRHSKIVGVQNFKTLFHYNIEMLCILTFQVLSRFSIKFLVWSRFSHLLGQILGYFWTWTNKMQISRFSWFPGSTGNPVISPLQTYGGELLW